MIIIFWPLVAYNPNGAHELITSSEAQYEVVEDNNETFLHKNLVKPSV